MSGKRDSKVVSGGGNTSSLGSPSFSTHFSRRAGVVALVIVLVVAGWAGYSYYSSHKQLKPKESGPVKYYGASSIHPIKVDYVQMENGPIASKVNYLVGTKQYGEAEKLLTIQKDINTNKTKLSLLARIQQIEGNKEAAASTADKIAALGDLSAGQYEQIAGQYEASGDKLKAAQYYQKSLDAVNANKQGAYKTDVTRLEAKIKELKQ